MRFHPAAVVVTLTAASLLLVGCASPAIVAPASVAPETATPKPTRTTFTAHGFVFVALSEEQRMADAEELVRSMHEDPEKWQRDLGKTRDCVSALGFDDIADGAQVRVVDEDGTVIGIGELGSGEEDVSTTTCRFRFDVEDIPLGRPFYGITVGNSFRGEVQFTEKQIRRGPRLYLD